MSYNIERYLKTLELDKILELLANETTVEDSGEEARKIIPETDIKKVKEKLLETETAYNLISRYSAPQFTGVTNVSDSLARAEASAVLSMRELLDIADNLRCIRSLKNWRENCSQVKESCIDYLFDNLVANKYLEDKIFFAIKSEDEISDNASPALYDIRRKIISKASKVRDILDKIIHGPSSKYLQEAIVTQRDGRFVVPLKVENKGQLSGIVHDTSATGSTLFIEPMSVVETNNEIRVLKLREQEEIERILSELSAEVGGFSNSINSSYKALVALNLIFAKAKLAYKMKAIVPNINENGKIYLKNARHPLISYKTVVPITVSLGGEYNTLIITGPNTGGKTVTIKTIGLLTLMAMCGLMIPCDDTSSISVFKKIFADIGDEQSIEQSLSTFSSHMVNIISILESADDESLILFDELCAGTDPVEGSALAKAILMRLAAFGSRVAATTHYPELKSYAIDTVGVQNASCEFDVATLKPTYRLIMGMPGRSNAFAISERLGLPNDIIENAKNQVSDEDMRFERVVAALEKAKFSADEEHKKALEIRNQLEKLKQKAEQKETDFEREKEKIMQKTRETANSIIENARYKSGLLLNELEEIKKGLTAENAATKAAAARASFRSTLKELEEASDPIVSKKNSGEVVTEISKGDIVIVADIGRDATVIEVNEAQKKAFVMSGSIKMWVSFDNLRKKKGSVSTEIKKTRNVTGLKSRAQRETTGELDIRGMASDEGILELDRYIDNALISGLETIRIIHGKGTGVLRKSVQAHLRSHKAVKSFRLGTFGEGENGVTIAELK